MSLPSACALLNRSWAKLSLNHLRVNPPVGFQGSIQYVSGTAWTWQGSLVLASKIGSWTEATSARTDPVLSVTIPGATLPTAMAAHSWSSAPVTTFVFVLSPVSAAHSTETFPKAVPEG